MVVVADLGAAHAAEKFLGDKVLAKSIGLRLIHALRKQAIRRGLLRQGKHKAALICGKASPNRGSYEYGCTNMNQRAFEFAWALYMTGS